MVYQNTKQAWETIISKYGCGLELDNESSERAGYKVYRVNYSDRYYDYVCDLGDRLELNFQNGKSENIWLIRGEVVAKEVIGYTIKSYTPHGNFEYKAETQESAVELYVRLLQTGALVEIEKTERLIIN